MKEKKQTKSQEEVNTILNGSSTTSLHSHRKKKT